MLRHSKQEAGTSFPLRNERKGKGDGSDEKSAIKLKRDGSQTSLAGSVSAPPGSRVPPAQHPVNITR